jgi:hypothetical protein
VSPKYTAAGVAVLLLTLPGCGGSSNSGSASKVPEVVAGPASAWTAVTVTTETASADVPADARKNLTPLLATRALDRPAPLSEYGLDHPQGELTYKGKDGSSVNVEIGQPNFDRHFLYVQRVGSPAVYLVPADTLRPVLALVGIEIKAPE